MFDLCLALYARCRINNIAVNVTFFDEAQSRVQADANVDLLDFGASLAIVFQRPLHSNGSPDGRDGFFKAGHNGVADGLHHAAARALDFGKQEAVMTVDHRHTLNVTLFFKVRRRSLNVAKEDGDRRA